jgi:hypothetical protein
MAARSRISNERMHQFSFRRTGGGMDRDESVPATGWKPVLRKGFSSEGNVLGGLFAAAFCGRIRMCGAFERFEFQQGSA